MGRRTWTLLLAGSFVALALQLLWVRIGGDRAPLAGASWIWASDVHLPVADEQESPPEPVAFLVARDVELTPEELAAGPALLDIVADEGYRAWVNGEGPAAGIYRSGAPVDRWDVAPALRPGTNRIVVELRSDRGAGGMLAQVRVGERSWSTDGSWRVVRTWDPGLLGGWAALETGPFPAADTEPARVWGRAPAGRWAVAEPRGVRTLPRTPSLDPPLAVPTRYRHPGGGPEEWIPRDPADPWAAPGVGIESLWDFGEEVEGLVALELGPPADRPALLYLGSEVPDPLVDHPRVVVPLPGAGRWEAIVPRRFRYLLLVGARPATWPLLLTGEGAGAVDAASEGAGVFGLRPPRERSRAEEMVWQRIREERKDGQGGGAEGSATGSKLSTPSSRPEAKR